ncbi:reverse transcriptase family protein [Nakamurella flava]|uniref:reverse transcriptase family protein n=1 Tax=Nakamurella flava TaxID=2576308 RepID=UPI00197CAA50|nr:reverse transcriptase family protein [Nakamurella flava]
MVDAIAGALLADADDWTASGLIGRVAVVFAGPHDWVPRLVEQVLELYPRPPADRPRELQAVVGVLLNDLLDPAPDDDGDEPTTEIRPVPRPVHWPVASTRTVRRPFATPPLDDAGDLAALLGVDLVQLTALADTRLRGRRARSEQIANYRYQWLDRPSGPRLLEAPRPRLLSAQRVVLHELLDLIPTHPAVHGFVSGRSVVTGAREHVGAETVLTLDLEHFFAAVTAGRIWGVLRSAGYPEPVAHLLAGLTTTATPVRVLTAMPPGPDPGRQFRLRRRLAVPHLPQGAPTSPALANLVAFTLDRRLAAYAAAVGLKYTRYADDLTFSGPFRQRAHVRSFARAVGRIVADERFRINEAKTRWRGRHERQTVTGVVVNEHPAIARDEVDRLRAVLHDCRRSGPAAANRHGHPDFRAHLLGRISWVASVHPARGARLREQFDGIDWTA